MKKIVLVFSIMLISAVSFAQNKPKSMRELRDSIFTVMKLSDENRQRMHEVIAENGKGQKAIKEDMTLTFGEKNEKLVAWSKEMSAKEKAILKPEELQIWKAYATSLRNKPKQ